MADAKKPIDWDALKADFIAGAMSNRDLARWYGISESMIRKKAKQEGWVRRDSAQGAGRALPEPEPVKIYHGTVLTPENTKPEHIIERGRSLVMRLLDELEATTCRAGELEAMIEAATDTGDRQREALMQAISLKTRSDVLKALSTAAKTLSEAGAPQGVKQARQSAGERVAESSSRFATPAAPRIGNA